MSLGSKPSQRKKYKVIEIEKRNGRDCNGYCSEKSGTKGTVPPVPL